MKDFLKKYKNWGYLFCLISGTGLGMKALYAGRWGQALMWLGLALAHGLVLYWGYRKYQKTHKN